MVNSCYYNVWTVDTQTEDINFVFMADPASNALITKKMKIVPSVTCLNTDGVGAADANGNNCASYNDLSSCTDCLCDAADDTMTLTASAMCCACGGG